MSTKTEPFARFPDMQACTLEMCKIGHNTKDAETICMGIQDRALKGALLKATPLGIEVLTKAESEDIVLGGYASWETVDDEGDLFTVDAQAKALQKFMSQPPEYQLITVNHGLGPASEFKVAHPILSYTDKHGQTYYTHVNEKGTYLLCKLRNDDMRATQYYRSKAKNGELNGYSVSSFALERKGNAVTDMEYGCITITEKGVAKPVNPMSRDVKTLSKSVLVSPTLKGADLAVVNENYELVPLPNAKMEYPIDAREMIEAILRKHGFCNSKRD
jgi:hypothetical protein